MPDIQHEEPYKLAHLADDAPVDEHGRCNKCRWWNLLNMESIPKNDNPRNCRRVGESIGECRASEPRLASCNENGHMEYEGLWPITYEKDWCGRFEAQKGKGGLAGKAKF